MSNNARFGLILVLGVLAGVMQPLSCRADENHYSNQLIGYRAAGLGGAYTAISDDPSGLYYNPAGIVYAQTSNLSASVNAFQCRRKNV